MKYESFEVVELGQAEVTIEIGLPEVFEELGGNQKYTEAVATYVEYDE